MDDSYLLNCTKEQRKRWEARAKESGMSLAAWIRKTLDDGPIYMTKVVRR